jgi:hypothetical protein
MVEWDTQTRGQNRQSESEYYEESDWDGKSCADYAQLPSRAPRDVESLTMLTSDPDRNN